MNAATEVSERVSEQDVIGKTARRPEPTDGSPAQGSDRVSTELTPWLRAQAINVTRHAAALRPFRRDEFGTGAAAPSDGHLQAVNDLVSSMRRELLRVSREVSRQSLAAQQQPSPAHLQSLMRHKERAHDWVRAMERIWDFYFELFGQRQGAYANWILSCDRIALDCYRYAFVGLGKARSVPAPPPFCYMRTGFSPATFRRGIPLKRLGRQINPFPLIQLPYHRLVNPWTLGAVLHEVSHNLQSDMGLNQTLPRAIARRLLAGGFPTPVAAIWTRWNRETFADLSALLLGGPAVVASLFDVIGRGPEIVLTYSPRGPHPTPYLRALISIELLRRMGFAEQAEQYRRAWIRIYPDPRAGALPRPLLDSFPAACAAVVDTICYRPYGELGDRSLAQVIRFEPKEQTMIEEAARRLAAGNDPGIVPERFLIGAARLALDRRLARPGTITTNFYRELTRR
jgi:hypothetical protein